MATFNVVGDLAQTFKGVFAIFDGATPFHYDQLQELVVSYSVVPEKHYSASGKKKVTKAGDDSNAQITVKSTSTLHDTASTPTDVKTISYWKYQMMTLNILPVFTFEGISEADAASNKYIHNKFDGVITDITEARNRGSGTYEAIITVEITSHTTDQRNATAPVL